MMKDIAQGAKQALILFIAFTFFTGLAYPLLITGIVQTAIPEKAGGSLIVVNDRIVGSELIGQNFSSPGYFQGRPSAVGYAANGSGASNLGPASSRLMDLVRQRVDYLRHSNNLSQNVSVPGELALASASGLDPHIRIQGALIQVARIAGVRGLPESEVRHLVYRHAQPAVLGLFGPEKVNVLRLNLALDELARRS